MRPGLGTTLRRLLALLDGEVERVYAEAGVDFRSRYYPVFRALEREGTCTIRALAHRSGLTHSALSQTITEMRRAGLVTVMPGEEDARERNVHLSAKGQRMLTQLQPCWEAIARAADGLDEELEGAMFRVLDGAIAALERHPFFDRIQEATASRPISSRPVSPRPISKKVK